MSFTNVPACKRFLAAASLAPVALLLGTMMGPLGCASNNSPSTPGAPTSTPTVTVSSNGPLIVAEYLVEQDPLVGLTEAAAILYMEDNLGNPVTTAFVSLETPNGNWALSCFGAVAFSSPPSSGVTSFTGGEYEATQIPYSANGNCTFQVVNGGATYISNFTALAPVFSGASGNTGVTFLWSNGGNYQEVSVTGKDTFQLGPSLTSPYAIPAADFPSDPAGGGNDTGGLFLGQILKPAFSGGQASCAVVSGSGLEFKY